MVGTRRQPVSNKRSAILTVKDNKDTGKSLIKGYCGHRLSNPFQRTARKSHWATAIIFPKPRIILERALAWLWTAPRPNWTSLEGDPPKIGRVDQSNLGHLASDPISGATTSPMAIVSSPNLDLRNLLKTYSSLLAGTLQQWKPLKLQRAIYRLPMDGPQSNGGQHCGDSAKPHVASIGVCAAKGRGESALPRLAAGGYDGGILPNRTSIDARRNETAADTLSDPSIRRRNVKGAMIERGATHHIIPFCPPIRIGPADASLVEKQGAGQVLGGPGKSTEDCCEDRSDDGRTRFGHRQQSCKWPRFTWTNLRKSGGHIQERLDRAVANPSWRVLFPNAEVSHLPRVHCDHCLILVDFNPTSQLYLSRPFRFENMWMSHPTFPNFVSDSWNEGRHVLMPASSSFTQNAVTWNKDVFGNIFHGKKHILARLDGIQKALAFRPSNLLVALEKELRVHYCSILQDEKELWVMKSRDDWIMEGDRNTKFFHVSTIIN
ncbi:hypothetical protein CRG98_007370 [Punica granatum]|uniref:Reverse transcriptase zinc-binding domain-containing protein n=1 Tax=Punica granatum TaxID=22663 RepID=A0A2I0KV57_PUNGR|nr:hypothetical protein CRG98_007370 [Punica granatum]